MNREYFYFLKCLDTGKLISREADVVIESASTIKVLILAALLSDVEAGKLRLTDTLMLKKEHYSHLGSGILQNFYRTHPFNIYNLALLMIILSDNVATNALIELLDKDRINEYCKSAGLKKTRLVMTRLTFPDVSSVKDTRIGETTAREMADFLEKLLNGKILNARHTRLVKKFMTNTQGTLFGRELATNRNTPKARKIKNFGNKTGACYFDVENLQVLNDCGFMTTTDSKNYIFAIYSIGDAGKSMQYSTDASSRIEFAKYSKQLFDELLVERK